MRNLFIIITTLIALTSCDLVDFDVDYGEFPECEMQLDRHQVYVEVGDSFFINPIFTPDTLPNREIFYYYNPEGLLAYDTECFHALREGSTMLYALSVNQRLLDSCQVSIMAPWVPDADKDYPYDMVVYADVTLEGEPFDPETMVLAAFVGNECRGVGVMRRAFGIDYMELRIGSELGRVEVIPDDEEDEEGIIYDGSERVTIRLYHRKEHLVYDYDKRIVFDEETHGTLSDLYPLEF